MGRLIVQRLVDFVRSLVFYVVFYVTSLSHALLAFAAVPIAPQKLGAIATAWARYHRFCARYLLGIRVEVAGSLPDFPVLLAYKHQSFFEAIDVPNLFPGAIAFAKAELLRIPLWGKAASVYGLIPVERDQGAKSLRTMIAAAKRESAAGRMIVIFPEGTRVPHGKVVPLQSGFTGIYKLLGLPVVPIAINSGPLYHRLWKRSGLMKIQIGEVIPAGLPREEIEMRVQTAINVLNEA